MADVSEAPPPADAARPVPTGRRPVVLIAATLAALLAAGVFAASRAGDAAEAVDEDAGPRATPVSVARVEWQDGYAADRTLIGRVESRLASDLAFEVPGTVEAVTADEGDRVEAGTVVASVDAAKLRAARDLAAARLAAAEAQMEELEAGPRRETVAAARAEVERLKATLELSRLTESRTERMFRRGSGTEQAFDEARLNAEATLAGLRNAEARLNELENGTRRETLERQRATVKEAAASLAAAESDVGKTSIAAPFAGRIAARLVDPGEVVAAGQTVLTLLQDGATDVRVGVPRQDAATLEVGRTIPVSVRGQTISGRVRAVRADRDDRTRSVDVLVEVAPGAGRDGDLAEIAMSETVEDRGFWLPLEGLVEGVRGLWTCFAVAEGPDGGAVADPRSVQILSVVGDRAFVTGPVEPGEAVVIAGVHRLVAGQAVRVAETAE